MDNKKELILIYGNGYITSILIDILNKEVGKKGTIYENIEYYVSNNRIENRESIINEIERLKPSYVINCAGKQGKPNADWCEDNKQEVIRSNVIGTLNLIDICYLKNIHITNLTSGCLYIYDKTHQRFSNNGFKEYEKSNFSGSFYAISRNLSEQLTYPYDSNTLSLRLRFQFCNNLNNPRNIISKLIKYKYIVNEPNSWSNLNDLCPIILDMTIKKYKGFYNFVNPGYITNNEVLDLYIKYIDSNLKYENITLKEQSLILKSDRSQCYLDTSKLESLYPNIPNIKLSIEQLFKNYKKL